MPKRAKELSALAVKHLAKPGLHFVGGVPGLGLQVLPTGGRSWVLRVMIGGKRRNMGLGGYPDVKLAEARETAEAARKQIRNNVDPIKARATEKAALRADAGKSMAFREAALAIVS